MHAKTLTLIGAALAVFATTGASLAQSNTTKDMNAKHMQSAMMKNLGTTAMFTGVEAKKGTASLSMKDGRYMLSVSADFVVPPSPAPHWQVVDKNGNVYLLNRFTIVGDKMNRSITLPKYVKSVAKVQVWCSFAEVLLGEAAFKNPIDTK